MRISFTSRLVLTLKSGIKIFFLNSLNILTGLVIILGLTWFFVSTIFPNTPQHHSPPSNEPTQPVIMTSTPFKQVDNLPQLTITKPQPANIPCFAPKFAPDGHRYLCRFGQPPQEMWLGSLDEGVVQLIENQVASYLWTPDGQAIIYANWTDDNIYPLKMFNLNTEKLIILGNSDLPHWMLDFTPNQELIHANKGFLFLTQFPLDQTQTKLNNNQRVTEFPIIHNHLDVTFSNHQVTFKFSADGTHVALLHGSYTKTLSILNISSGDIIAINNYIGTGQDNFSWSPDGKKLAYGLPFSWETNQAELWVVDADGHNP